MNAETSGGLQARLTRGARAGLAGPTATLPWPAPPADPARNDAMDAALRAQVERLWPGDPLPLLQAADWPAAFLVAEEGDRMAQWFVALAVAIQWRARDPVGRGRVVTGADGGVEVALPWQRETVVQGAITFAGHYLRALLAGGQTPELEREFARWLQGVQAEALPPNTWRFGLAAQRRGIPLAVREGMVWLGWGCHMQRMDSSFTGNTGNIAARLARLKPATSRLLRGAGIPVPAGRQVGNWEQARALATRLGWPVVVKPANQDQGVGVVPGIRDEAALRAAFEEANRLSPQQVIVEKHVEGADHRMLVVGGRLLAAARRDPAAVRGDGEHSIAQLVELANRNPMRGTSKRSLLMRLTLDAEALDCLAQAQLTVDSVPPAGALVRLRKTANLSTGGTPVDVTAVVHPDNRLLVERAATTVGLDIAGVDLLCPDIRRSWREVGGAICEVNAQPGFRPHWVSNPAHDVNGAIIDWLFARHPARIPVAAVLGGAGALGVAHLTHRTWVAAGRRVALAATDGSWLGDAQVLQRDAACLAGARVALHDPLAEAAVLQLQLPVVAEEGHPCDRYDALAWTGGVPSGADAPLVREAMERTSGAVVLSALALPWAQAACPGAQRRWLVLAPAADEPAFRHHVDQGGEGLAVVVRDGVPWIGHFAGTAPPRWLAPLPPDAAPPVQQLRLQACALMLALGIVQRRPQPQGE